ncbi:hypothetical protein [Microvirga zambiensis]|uniref:hypothetical protein n=1 Tax=Microvirga zambiensis TaxID=1402137 RepID=UPI00191F4176|nr:hypothetical protein [Microvirga zambiensis]
MSGVAPLGGVGRVNQARTRARASRLAGVSRKHIPQFRRAIGSKPEAIAKGTL